MRLVIAGSLVVAAALTFARQPRSCPYIVEGVVRGDSGSPLEEARVTVDGLQLGASSDSRGHYRLRIACAQVASAAQLRYRRIGYEATVRPLSLGEDSVVRIDVALKTWSVPLGGVIVVSLPDAEEFARRVPRYAAFQSSSSPATIGGPFDRVSVRAIRQFLRTREIPPANSFGLEGLIQHPDVAWPLGANESAVALVIDEIPAPWAAQRTLVRASLVTRPSTRARTPRNVVFVIDAAGENWHLLPGVRRAISRAVSSLDDRDRVSIVAFRGPRGALLVGARGTEHAQIRSALDSVENGAVGAETNVFAISERVAAASARPGLETRIVFITDEGGVGSALGSENLIADVRRIRANGMRIDVVNFGDDAPSDRMRAIALGGGGDVHAGNGEAALHASVGRVFDVVIPRRATRPSFELRFDARRVARWRCLNDVGERTASSASRKSETLYAGASVTVLCETEPRDANGATNTRVTATYLDQSGVEHSLDGDSAPDSLLRDETRLIAHSAGFGLWLANPAALGQWSSDSVAIGIDDPAGYGAELRRLARRARESRR